MAQIMIPFFVFAVLSGAVTIGFMLASGLAAVIDYQNGFNLVVLPSTMFCIVLMFCGSLRLVQCRTSFADGAHSLYSFHYLWWTFAGELNVWMYMLIGQFIRGTVVMQWYLQLLGARVGNNVYFDTTPGVEARGLTLEDDVVVEADAMVLGHVVDHGRLVLLSFKAPSLTTIVLMCSPTSASS